MQLEPPRHGDLLITGQIDKMSHNFIDVWFWALSFDRNVVALVGLDWLFLDVGSFYWPISGYSHFFKGHKTIVKLVFNEDGRIEWNRHIQKLKRTVRHEFEYQAIRKLLANLHSESAIRASGRPDGAWNVRLGVNVFEDDALSKADFLSHVATWWERYFSMLS